MRSKTSAIGLIGIVIGLLLAAAGIVVADSMTPSDPPGSSTSSYTGTVIPYPLGSTSTHTLAAIPYPPLPPYQPVPMSYNPDVSGLVVYNNTNGVALIDSSNHTISPVLLNEFDYTTIDPDTGEPVGGKLGSEGGGRFDVAMTRDGLQALISNFGDSKVFFIDLSSGTPVVVGMAKIDMFAEDIAIDPTNQWALVTDGGFSPKLALLHIPTRTWVPAGVDPVTLEPFSYQMPIDPGPDPVDPNDDVQPNAQAVAITPDGRTVIVADYWAGAINVLLFDPATGGLAFQQTVRLWKYGTDENALFPFLYRPVNVAISPDGRTVMAIQPNRSTSENPDPDPNAFYEGSNIAMFLIDQPGHVVRQPDVILPWRIGGAQSAVFSADGRKAYVETIYYDEWPPNPIPPDVFWFYQEIQELTITSPGNASLTRSVRMPTPRGTSQFFGVDIMAITPDGNFLYVTNPTQSGAEPVIDVIDLRTFTHVKSIGTPQQYPDPVRNWPDKPEPPDLNNPQDWIPEVFPVGIAFSNKAVTKTTLTSSKNPVNKGASVTFTAKVVVVAPGSGTPTGKVKFQSDGVNIPGCTAVPLDAAGKATCTKAATNANKLSVGWHDIVAKYLGDGNYKTSDSAVLKQKVNGPPTALALSQNWVFENQPVGPWWGSSRRPIPTTPTTASPTRW